MAKGGAKEICKEDGCVRSRVGWGLCGMHYQRFIRLGNTKPTHRSQARAETIAEDGTRKCWKCGERKPFTSSYFPNDPRRPGELKGTCSDCTRRAVRRSGLAARYGLTETDYLGLLQSQDGKCRLCLTAFDPDSKAYTPHIDHNHQTGRVRGILCHHCNVLLGHAKDSADLLASAIKYLEASNAD